jgi:hypothetical protein
MNLVILARRRRRGRALTALTIFYNDRVVADGGVVESLECVDKTITDLNWDYYV